MIYSFKQLYCEINSKIKKIKKNKKININDKKHIHKENKKNLKIKHKKKL